VDRLLRFLSNQHGHALRFKMAYSADATTVVLGAFISTINSDLRRRARKRKLRGRLQTWGNSRGKTRTSS
jgi:hypothetical protein